MRSERTKENHRTTEPVCCVRREPRGARSVVGLRWAHPGVEEEEEEEEEEEGPRRTRAFGMTRADGGSESTKRRVSCVSSLWFITVALSPRVSVIDYND